MYIELSTSIIFISNISNFIFGFQKLLHHVHYSFCIPSLNSHIENFTIDFQILSDHVYKNFVDLLTFNSYIRIPKTSKPLYIVYLQNSFNARSETQEGNY